MLVYVVFVECSAKEAGFVLQVKITKNWKPSGRFKAEMTIEYVY
jgi:hypothetical protein